MFHQLAHRKPGLKNSGFICFWNVNSTLRRGLHYRIPARCTDLPINKKSIRYAEKQVHSYQQHCLEAKIMTFFHRLHNVKSLKKMIERQ